MLGRSSMSFRGSDIRRENGHQGHVTLRRMSAIPPSVALVKDPETKPADYNFATVHDSERTRQCLRDRWFS